MVCRRIFFDNDVKPAFNMSSGYVFLINSEYQACMLCDGTPDTLEVWHTLPYSGEEGFIFDLQDLDRETMHPDDVEYLTQFDATEA